MGSWIRYEIEGEPFFKNMAGCTLDQVLCAASNFYAFDDCTDISVLEIVHDGRHYHYEGWQPGMTFSYRDDSGEIVWQRSFPHWDH